MSTYRKEWDCCDSVTETQAWEPEHCPFCYQTPAEAAAPQMLGTLMGVRDALYCDENTGEFRLHQRFDASAVDDAIAAATGKDTL